MTDVLYLMGGLGLGGTERHLSLVLPQLARRGWRLEVALLTEIGCFGEPLAAAGVPVRALGKPRVPPIPKLRGLLQLRGQAQLLAERLRLLHPRILHCFLPTCCIVGSWAARAAGYKSVAMSRRSQASRPSLFLGDKWLELRALSTANIVLGHSHWVMRELENEGVAPECLRLVHNGIALTPRRLDNQERNAIRATEGWLEDEPIIVSVANLIPYKGHVELLKALGQVAAAGMRRWRLVLIGDGAPQYVKTLHSLAADLQIMDRIQFAGIRHDIGRLLAGADLGVLASHHEGFSNALLEYMDAGLPVVATSIGGNLDAVEDGKTGILVPAARSDVLADAFIRLLNDPALCIRFGAAGRAKVEAEFSLDHCIAGYEDAYRWLLARTSGRGAS